MFLQLLQSIATGVYCYMALTAHAYEDRRRDEMSVQDP